MTKISLNQINESQNQTVQFFRCSYDSSHLVEDALMCQICHSIQCKDCYLTKKKCFKCKTSINPDQAQLPDYLKKLINPICIKCENSDRGCNVEIDYENYRKHTRNCKYMKKIENRPKNQNSSCSFLKKILCLFCKKKKRYPPNNEISINEESTQNLSEEIFRKPNNFGEPKDSNEIPKFNSMNQNLAPKPKLSSNNFGSYSEMAAPSYSNKNETSKNFTPSIPNSTCHGFGSQQNPKLSNLMNQNETYNNSINNKREPAQNPSPLPNYFQNAIKNLQNNNINESNSKKEPRQEQILKGPNQTQNAKITEKQVSQEKINKPIAPIIKNDDLVKFTNSDYEILTNKQLKAILARRGIPKSGNKSELIEKIKLYVENYKNKGKNKSIMDKLSVKCKPVSESSSDSDSSLSSCDSDLSDEMDNFFNYYYFPGLNISDSQLKKLSSKQLERFTNDDLKIFLDFRNISKIGNKEELIFKIKKYFKDKEEKKQKKGSFTKKIQKKKDKLMEKSLDELKYLMMKNCLPITGTKSDLVDRMLRKQKFL